MPVHVGQQTMDDYIKLGSTIQHKKSSKDQTGFYYVVEVTEQCKKGVRSGNRLQFRTTFKTAYTLKGYQDSCEAAKWALVNQEALRSREVHIAFQPVGWVVSPMYELLIGKRGDNLAMLDPTPPPRTPPPSVASRAPSMSPPPSPPRPPSTPPN